MISCSIATNSLYVPITMGGDLSDIVTIARLRCSPTAALNLRNAIDATLKVLEQPQQAPAATAKSN